MRSERGQGSVEYVALILLVAALLAGVVAAGAPEPEPPRWLAAKMCAAWKGSACRGGEHEARGPVFAGARSSPAGLAAPARPDTDRDGLDDALELELGTDPLEADADGDGRGDREEIARGTEPLGHGGRRAVRRALLGDRAGGGLRSGSVSRAFAHLPPARARSLARRHPEVVGALDGAPAELRAEANRLLMRRARERLGFEVARLDRALGRPGRKGGIRGGVARRVAARRRDRLAGRGRQFDAWASDPRRRFLLFDARGDGRVAEVVGDLERAPHVAVMVPGTGSDIDNFERHLAPRARTVRAAARRESGTEVAVVAWLGYDPPDTIPGAAFGGRARHGGRALARFVGGLGSAPRAHSAVIGHSYGSVVAGNAAARHGLRVDDVVFTGSPGTGGRRRDVSALGGRSRFWAGETARDLVALAPVHGEAPGDPGFGARVFDVSGEDRPLHHVVHNHMSYYRRGSRSLRNLARIVGGRPDRVTAPPDATGRPG